MAKKTIPSHGEKMASSHLSTPRNHGQFPCSVALDMLGKSIGCSWILDDIMDLTPMDQQKIWLVVLTLPL
jgi:hypothetical protein